MEKSTTRESRRSYDKPYKASIHFNERLAHAIKRGQELSLAAALKMQEQNDVTSALSNHLLVRSFLAEQKYQLTALDRALDETVAAEKIQAHVEQYADQLKQGFESTFIADEDDSKLSGDALFREALSVPGTEGIVLARRIAEVDASQLASPEEILQELGVMTATIAEDLYGGIEYLREDGVSDATLEHMKEVVAFQIEVIDAALVKNMPRVP